MRRYDREITDPGIIRAVLDDCLCCRLGFADNGEVYIVPLHFGWEENDGHLVLYFHGAHEGRKAELAATSPKVGFELDTGYELKRGETPCSHTAAFQSIIGTGCVKPVTESAEKIRCLALVMSHTTGRGGWKLTPAMAEAVSVWRLDVETLACKIHE